MRHVLVAVGLALSTAGCRTSPPARFYSLSSLQAPAARSPAAEHAPLVAVGPVTIPDSVDRPEIVTAIGPHEVAVHDFDRWAGDLGKDLTQALLQDLAAALPPDRFSVVPWEPSSSVSRSARRITVNVTRFDLTVGGAAVLEAEWTLLEAGGKTAKADKAAETAPAQGGSIKDVVEAMSRCVARLSAEMAAAMK